MTEPILEQHRIAAGLAPGMCEGMAPLRSGAGLPRARNRSVTARGHAPDPRPRTHREG